MRFFQAPKVALVPFVWAAEGLFVENSILLSMALAWHRKMPTTSWGSLTSASESFSSDSSIGAYYIFAPCVESS